MCMHIVFGDFNPIGDMFSECRGCVCMLCGVIGDRDRDSEIELECVLSYKFRLLCFFKKIVGENGVEEEFRFIVVSGLVCVFKQKVELGCVFKQKLLLGCVFKQKIGLVWCVFFK